MDRDYPNSEEHAMKLRRSVLYVPANKPRALEKSRTLPADCVIFDLEDSVAPHAKQEAREQLVSFLQQYGSNGQERVVRINHPGSGFAEADLQAIRDCTVDGILLPKIRTAQDIHVCRALLGPAREASPALWVMVETAAAVLNLSGIAVADPAIRVLVLGLEDLALETRMQYKPGRGNFAHILSHCVLVARAHGLDAIDGVFTRLDDEQGFETECRQAFELGFDGKSLVHPRQVESCNRAFTPGPEAVAEARAIVDAWQQQPASGHSVIVVDGRMIEQLHVNQAQRVLALAEAASG